MTRRERKSQSCLVKHKKLTKSLLVRLSKEAQKKKRKRMRSPPTKESWLLT